MTDPAIVTEKGVGAWHPRSYFKGMLFSTDPFNKFRENMVWIAYQKELIKAGLLQADPAKLNGVPGVKTDAAIRTFQLANDLEVDGVIGPHTNKCFWRHYYVFFQANKQVPDNLVFAINQHESELDVGAQGYDTPHDCGIAQINTLAHNKEGFTPRVCFSDPVSSIAWTASTLRSAFDTFKSWPIAIANHNSPQQALDWYKTGLPPSKQIDDYVHDVYRAISEFNKP